MTKVTKNKSTLDNFIELISSKDKDLQFKFIEDKPVLFKEKPCSVAIYKNNLEKWKILFLDEEARSDELNELEFETIEEAIDELHQFELNFLPSKVMLNEYVYDKIFNDASFYSEQRLESGGYLFGDINPKYVNITAVINASNDAVRAQCSFRTIPEKLNYKVNHFVSKGLKYLGEWHLHPFDLSTLSQTDLNTIEKILKGNERKFLPFGIFTSLLVYKQNDQLLLKVFLAKLNQNNKLLLREVNVDVIKNKNWKLYIIDESVKNSSGYCSEEDEIVVLSEDAPSLKKNIVLIDDKTALIDGEQANILKVNTDKYYARHGNMVSSNVLSKKVMLIGTGSVGSRLAFNLAPLVREMSLIDFDQLEMENIVRWGIALNWKQELGKSKSKVLAEYLSKTFHHRRFVAENINILTEQYKFIKTLKTNKPDIIICSTDTEISRKLVNQIAYSYRITSIFVTLSEKALSGQIYFSIPGKTGCYQCFSSSMFALNNSNKPNIDVYGTSGGVPGLNININLISAVASKIIYDFLDEPSHLNKFLLKETDNIFWIAADNTWIFERPLEIITATQVPVENCPICSKSVVDLVNDRT